MPPPKQLADYAFKPGHRGGPGRPPGMRNRLTEIAFQMLGDDFAKHGAEAIAKVRRERTHVYLQVVASLMPRQVQIEKNAPFEDITDEELQLLEDYLAAARAKLVKQIETEKQAPEADPAVSKNT